MARRSDPETSHAAAAGLSSERVRSVRAAVLRLFEGREPMTDEALIALYRKCSAMEIHDLPSASDSRIRTSRHELAMAGALVSVGTVRNARGFACFLWRLA